MTQITETKRCGKCCTALPLSRFSKQSSSADGLQWACKDCNAAYVATNREKILGYMADHHRLRLYGLTPEAYEATLERQNHCCASCFEPFGAGRKHTDHSHDCCPGKRSCGKCVRGILCTTCNTTAGHVESGRVAKIEAYLERWRNGQ